MAKPKVPSQKDRFNELMEMISSYAGTKGVETLPATAELLTEAKAELHGLVQDASNELNANVEHILRLACTAIHTNNQQVIAKVLDSTLDVLEDCNIIKRETYEYLVDGLYEGLDD